MLIICLQFVAFVPELDPHFKIYPINHAATFKQDFFTHCWYFRFCNHPGFTNTMQFSGVASGIASRLNGFQFLIKSKIVSLYLRISLLLEQIFFLSEYSVYIFIDKVPILKAIPIMNYLMYSFLIFIFLYSFQFLCQLLPPHIKLFSQQFITIINLSMIINRLLIIFTIYAISTASDQSCYEYIEYLNNTYFTNKTQFAKQMKTYMLYSGKQVDDLGFPYLCINNTLQTYHTVQINIPNQYGVDLLFYGLCFTSQCSTQDLNRYGYVLVNDILEIDVSDSGTFQFIQPSFDRQMTVSAILLYIGFGIMVLASMYQSLMKWKGYCQEKQKDQLQKLISRYSMSLDDDQELHQEEKTLLEKMSLEINFKQLRQQEQTRHIYAFSVFKFFSVPLIIFGQLFYLGNIASFNYFSLNEEIYQTFYSKIALSSYYIPDIFFFISGLLLTRKIISIDVQKENTFDRIVQTLKTKFIRLYPLYIIVVLIFWCMSPTTHSGPVWHKYQQQTKYCNGSWWRVILLIDNWFEDSCYSPAWYVQVELQLVFLTTFFFFTYFRYKNMSYTFLSVVLGTFWILLFTISGPIPQSVETTTSTTTLQYFKSTYSHAPFYLTGVLFAIFLDQQIFTSFVINHILKRKLILLCWNLVGIVILVTVILRPKVWYSLLGFELALSRTGILVSFIIFYLPFMVKTKLYRSSIHKYAKLVYPIILVSGMISMSSFWSFQTFPYLSGSEMISQMIPIFFVSCLTGGLLGLLFMFISPKSD